MTISDARHLPETILKGPLEPFRTSCFDRIETSNVADYVTVPRILNDWGPLLNRQNRHAALLMYLMNWQGYELSNPDLRPLSKMSKALVTKYSSIIVGAFILKNVC